MIYEFVSIIHYLLTHVRENIINLNKKQTTRSKNIYAHLYINIFLYLSRATRFNFSQLIISVKIQVVKTLHMQKMRSENPAHAM